MTPLKPEQKESIIKRLAFAQVELEDLQALKKTTYNDYSSNRQLKRNLERIVENLANATIDITKIYLASELVEMPETYRETIYKLVDVGLIDQQTAKELANLVRARNILAHQYLDLSWSLISQFINQGMSAFASFLQHVAKRIEQAD